MDRYDAKMLAFLIYVLALIPVQFVAWSAYHLWTKPTVYEIENSERLIYQVMFDYGGSVVAFYKGEYASTILGQTLLDISLGHVLFHGLCCLVTFTLVVHSYLAATEATSLPTASEKVDPVKKCDEASATSSTSSFSFRYLVGIALGFVLLSAFFIVTPTLLHIALVVIMRVAIIIWPAIVVLGTILGIYTATR